MRTMTAILGLVFISSTAFADICGVLKRGAHQAFLDDGTKYGIDLGDFSAQTINLQIDSCVCFEGTISSDGNHPTDGNNVKVTSVKGEMLDRQNDRSSRCAHEPTPAVPAADLVTR